MTRPVQQMSVTIKLTILVSLLCHHGQHHVARAFSDGPPAEACETMTPDHGAPLQTSQSPYTIGVSATEVAPSGNITVTISGIEFKGFMASVFMTGYTDGKMVPLDDSSKAICNDLSISHTNAALKKEVSFAWIAPNSMPGGQRDIVIQATVVREFMTIWTDIKTTTPITFVEKRSPPGGEGKGGGRDSQGDVLPPPGPVPQLQTPNAGPQDSTPTANSNNNSNNKFPGHLSEDPECGQTKACFHDCLEGVCTFIVTWDNEGDDLAMDMVYRLPNSREHWIGVGFSKDQEMGDDSVTECVMHDGEVKIKQSYNEGLNNKYLDNIKAALSNQEGRIENGLLQCSFHRKKSYPREPLLFDLNNDYYVMVAVGEAMNGVKIQHAFDMLPPVSDHKIDFQALDNVHGEEPPTNYLVQIHGQLMIIAWVMMASIGMITAKYGKPMFPKFNPCEVNIWFHIHRLAMLLTVVLTVLAVIIMAVQCEGYCQIPQLKGEGKSHWPLHPVLGIMVLILTITNPIMALFRPAPNAPNRFVFNSSHWGVGVLAWILASLTIFIGLDIEKSHAPTEAMHVLLAWVVYHILFLVAMEMLPRPLCRLYGRVAEKTIQRGRVYNLEKAHHDNLGYQDPDASSSDPQTADTTVAVPAQLEKKTPETKELTREELKVQKMLLLGHYAVVVILTLTLLLVVYLYTPPPHSHDYHW